MTVIIILLKTLIFYKAMLKDLAEVFVNLFVMN